jgi:hypothetical protein
MVLGGKKKKRGLGCTKMFQAGTAADGKRPLFEDPPETVNHPAHYNTSAIEVIDAIEAWGLGFNTGNAVKYLARAGKKDPAKTIEDLEKGRWYINREITRLGKLRKK